MQTNMMKKKKKKKRTGATREKDKQDIMKTDKEKQSRKLHKGGGKEKGKKMQQRYIEDTRNILRPPFGKQINHVKTNCDKRQTDTDKRNKTWDK